MDPFTIAALLGGGSSAIKGLAGLFGYGDGKNPADVANKELDNIPGQIKPYYDPYINAGRGALGKLTDEYGNLIDNPGKKLSDLGAGYKESPGYQATLRTALAGANNAAAMGQGGGLGTYGHEQLAAGAAGDVANKDYEQYLKHVLGLYGVGLGGEGEINQQGFEGSKDYADALGQIGGQKAAYGYSGQDWKNKNNSQNWSNLIGGVSSGAAGYFLGPEINKYFNNTQSGG